MRWHRRCRQCRCHWRPWRWTDLPAAVCPVNCFYTTADAVVLHSKDLCIGCGYCFYACPFGAPQYPKVGNFGSRGKMDKCTYCAGGPEADGSKAESPTPSAFAVFRLIASSNFVGNSRGKSPGAPRLIVYLHQRLLRRDGHWSGQIAKIGETVARQKITSIDAESLRNRRGCGLGPPHFRQSF